MSYSINIKAKKECSNGNIRVFGSVSGPGFTGIDGCAYLSAAEGSDLNKGQTVVIANATGFSRHSRKDAATGKWFNDNVVDRPRTDGEAVTVGA